MVLSLIEEPTKHHVENVELVCTHSVEVDEPQLADARPRLQQHQRSSRKAIEAS
jgi:hypothetical protein